MTFYPPIDRNALIRADTSLVKDILQNADTRILIWYEGKLIIRGQSSLYFHYAEISKIAADFSEFMYLGRHQNLNYFTCQLQHWHNYFDGLQLSGLRSATRQYSDFHLGLLFYSHGLVNWHQNHSFCSNCGGSTSIIKSGHERKCDNTGCRRSHYPKIDPAVIFSVVNNSGDVPKILLARKAEWDQYRHAVLAGFVEPGETLEDTVKREALEESNLTVDNISYAGSQSWPFPGQIMLGFSCETTQWDITLVDQELESANWFSAAEIETKVKAGKLKMPFQFSISWQLIDTWFFQQTGSHLESEVKS